MAARQGVGLTMVDVEDSAYPGTVSVEAMFFFLFSSRKPKIKIRRYPIRYRVPGIVPIPGTPVRVRVYLTGASTHTRIFLSF